MDPETRYKLINLFLIFGWAILYAGYVIGGGYLINEIERDNDYNEKVARKEKLLNTLEKYNYSSNDTVIREIISVAIEAHSYGVSHIADLEKNLSSSWDWCTGIFFCNTLATTVGYGHMYPRTLDGKVFCVFYPILGIIIIGVLVIKLGSAVAKFIEQCDSVWKGFFTPKTKKKKNAPSKLDLKTNILIIQLVVTIILSTLFVWFLPALVLTRLEGWSFLTALYFCLITLSTIGLGDTVPWNKGNDGPLTDRHAIYQLVSILYIFIGLVMLSTILHLVTAILCDVAISQAQDILQQTKKIIVDNTYKVENMLLQTKEKIKDSSDTVELMLKQTKANIKDNSLIVEDMLLQTKERVKDRNSAVADLLKQTKAKIKNNNNILEEMLQDTKDKMKCSNVLVEDMLVNTKNKIISHSIRGGPKMEDRENASTIDGFKMRQSDRIKAASKMIRGGSMCVGSKMRRSLQLIKPKYSKHGDVLPRHNKTDNPDIFIKIVAEKALMEKKETIYDN